jgi:hypothetical protein
LSVVAIITWRRHSGDSVWHLGAESAGSFVTLCRGRWPLSSERDGLVEHDQAPARVDRCNTCVDERGGIDRIELGLRELCDAVAFYDLERAPGAFGFDLGGESE